MTKEGCAQLHKLFLSRFSKFVFIVEECLQRRVIPNLTCMFVRGTDFKVRMFERCRTHYSVRPPTTPALVISDNIGQEPHKSRTDLAFVVPSGLGKPWSETCPVALGKLGPGSQKKRQSGPQTTLASASARMALLASDSSCFGGI